MKLGIWGSIVRIHYASVENHDAGAWGFVALVPG